MEPWVRYESIVDDVEDFEVACRTPLPTVVRLNQIKTNHSRLRRALEAEGIGITPRSWNPHTLELDTPKPGRTWPYQHGWFIGQEEISQLPARVLDPAPGSWVWDAAAAPGGKATQLAAMVRDSGVVVANDVNLGRLSALRSNADRLGVDNLVVTQQDARTFSLAPFDVDSFDATLVDAPCSGEGTVRKNPHVIDEWSLEGVHSLSNLQTGILRRAIQATKPGGTVVYATCTFAPEENEGVLSGIVESEPATVEPYDLGLDHAPGLTEWQGTTYAPAVQHGKRFYPHQNDTGGFFCAKLRMEG